MARSFSVSLVAAALALAFAASAPAQTEHPLPGPPTVAAPDYSSALQSGNLSSDGFNTPESDGRPGIYYFDLGAQAFRKHDYVHAIAMYKVAASWAYKPAEYNLALMYYRGEGTPADHALGAAWMVLAAERNTPIYVRARDLMITSLSDSEFQRTDALWNQLKPTYGDEVALRRAKAQWVRVSRNRTGTHVGGAAGELKIGAPDAGAPPMPSATRAGGAPVADVDGSRLLSGGAVDGSVAYSDFQQSDNPYDPLFQKNLTGTATVGSLAPVKPGGNTSQKPQDDTGHNP